jgi:hypothetical protein
LYHQIRTIYCFVEIAIFNREEKRHFHVTIKNISNIFVAPFKLWQKSCLLHVLLNFFLQNALLTDSRRQIQLKKTDAFSFKSNIIELSLIDTGLFTIYQIRIFSS